MSGIAREGWPDRRKRRRHPPLPVTGRQERLRWWIPALLPYIVAVGLIGFLDATTPPPIFAGTLFVVPILAASRSDHPQMVYVIFFLSMAALLASMAIAWSGDETPAIWLPNRIIEIVALPGSTILALALQRQRMEARRARNRADQARGVSEILSGLVAHDLRAPIATTLQALPHLGGDSTAAERADLITSLRSRLTRSLVVSDAVLGAAHAGLGGPTAREAGVTCESVSKRLQLTVMAFEAEAAGRGKTIALDLAGLGTGVAFVNSPALHQAVVIVLDNAVRYAVPGTIYIRLERPASRIEVSVSDQGPGLSAGIASEGARIGLDLCRAMLRRAGGDLEVARDAPDGTTLRIRLPDHVTETPVG